MRLSRNTRLLNFCLDRDHRALATSAMLRRAISETLEPRRLLSNYSLAALASFDGINQNLVYSNLVMDAAGDLYGTSSNGGAGNDGTVFEVAKGSGAVTTVAAFNGANGTQPLVGMIMDATGDLFGVTAMGGSAGMGTVFEVANGSGTITTLANFLAVDGSSPSGELIMDASGNFYGTTAGGGAAGSGTVFELPSGSGTITTLAAFGGNNGAFPDAGLVMDASGDLFGTASQGGAASEGTVFELPKGSGAITAIGSFNAANGSDPQAALIMDASGNLYGTTADGGKTGLDAGTVFEVAKGGTTITTLASFAGTDGANPVDRLYIDAKGNLFGTANVGGASYSGPGTGDGTIFEVANGSGTITDLADFTGSNGQDPFSGLIPDSLGNFYGTTLIGGDNTKGVVFQVTPPPGPATQVVFSSQPNAADVNTPNSPAITVNVEDANGTLENTDTSSVTLKIATGPAGATLGGTATAKSINGVATFNNLSLNVPGAYTLTATDGTLSPATSTSFSIVLNYSLTTIAAFAGTNGAMPLSGTVVDSQGNLYGTTNSGGAGGRGAIYEIAKGSGAITTLASFNVTNGSSPYYGSLAIDPAGNLYGTTKDGGVNNVGTIFELMQGTGSITTLANFNGVNGANPYDGLLLDSAGNLYGTTLAGGSSTEGTVFEVASGSGVVTTLADFDGTNGGNPVSGLIMDAAGNLYGTASTGGIGNRGTVYEVVKNSGLVSMLATFDGVIGSNPQAGLVMDAAGNLYGTVSGGTDNPAGAIFEVAKGSAAIVTLADFPEIDGTQSASALYLDPAGNLFGTTEFGGANGDGGVFELAHGDGTIVTLADFDAAHGIAPVAGLLADGFGNLYGTTSAGGDANGDGTVFELAANAGPAAKLAFVAQPAAAAVGASLSPAVTVAVEDINGVIAAGDNSTVTLAINSGPPGTSLGGTVSAQALNGIATFPNLTLNQIGGYTLSATDAALTAATSASFSVTQFGLPVAAGLVFTALPATAVTGVTLPSPVTVSVNDANGNVVATDASTVTLLIASGPIGGVLSGTLSESATSGIATFSNLSFSVPGNYTLAATDSLLTPATSVAITTFAPAKVGGLNPTFGVGGIASHNVGLTSTAGLVLQSDGKSVIVGTTGSLGNRGLGITRYNADGSLDTTFGTDGVTITPIPGDVQAAGEIHLLDGDILVAGTDTTFVNGLAMRSQFVLVEYTSDGLLDTTFGNGAGYVLTSFSSASGTLSNDIAHALAVGGDGTIYVGGSSDAGGHGLDFAVAAYTSSGSPAPSFGTNGKVLLDFLGGDDSIATMAIGLKGELVAAGSAADPSTGVSSVALAEFLPSGALDPKFGVKGKITTSVGGVDDAASSLKIGAKGTILIGGYTAIGSASVGTLSANFLLARYTAAGKLDKSFGAHGIVITSFNQPAAITGVLIDPDGTIIASGKTVSTLTSLNVSELDLALARYTAKGQPDTTFNGTGQAIFSLSVPAAPASLTAIGGVGEQPALLRSTSLTPFDTTAELMAEFKQLTQADQGLVAITPTGELFGAGTNGGNTVEAAIIVSGLDLTAGLTATLPQSIVGGGKGTASVVIDETGTLSASGNFSVELFASSSPSLPPGATAFQSFVEKLKLKQGTSKSVHLKFQYPSSLGTGNYYLVATVGTGIANDLNLVNNTSASATTVLIAPPFVQLAGSGLTTPTFVGAKPASVSFTITNTGNETASTPSAVQFFASTSGTPSGAISLITVPLHLNLKPHAAHVFKVKLSLPATLPAATYSLVALLDPANVFNDPHAATNFIVSGSTFAVS